MHEGLEAARTLLVEHAVRLGVHDLSMLSAQADGRGALTLKLDIDGERVPLRLLLPVGFPFGEIEMMLEAPDWHRFAHQSSEGKICPRPTSITSHDASRVIEAIEAARDWLGAACSGALTPAGGRYELPDVPVRRHETRVLFDEEAIDHARWAPYVGTAGPASVVRHARAWAVAEFRDASGTTIAQRTSIRDASEPAVKISARWIMVKEFAAEAHRVARTWGELRGVFPELDRVVRQAWNDAEGELAFVLVGMPMPAAWGGAPIRMHWQPIVFPSYQTVRADVKTDSRIAGRRIKGRHLAPGALWGSRSPIAREDTIPWAVAEDVSRDRLYVRSTVSRRGFDTPVLIGCGAIGSAVADILVRGGVPRIGLIDRETLEYGNLCRHVLDGASVGDPKALALAVHLQLVSPSVRARGFRAALPPRSTLDQERFDEALRSADLVIDASGDDEVLDWLATLSPERQIASVWTNSDASVGIGVLSGLGDGTSVAELRVRAREAIYSGAVPGVSSSAYAGPELVLPGTGCWHPTFRGSWSRIVGLGGAFCDWLAGAARGGRDGRVVVFRFHLGTWQRARSWSVAVPKKAP